MNRIFFLLVFCFFLNLLSFGQGTMHKASEHHIGILDFFNNHPFKNENGKITHPSPNTNGLLNSKNGWYEEQGIKVKGLVESAALQVDWWLLFNEPTEQYEFQWLSSGKYDIQFTDSKGKPISTTITKSQLEKYPDLLKRFNALQPTDMQFEIKWRIGDQTKANNDAFQKKYKLMGSIGSTLPHVKAEFTTQVKNSLLFEPSGIKPFASPSIRPGKGKAFLGVATSYSDEKLRQVFEYWKISEGHVVNSFKVIKQNWPVQEMKTIAEKFLRYEKGEADPTPKETVAAANEKNKNTPAYGKNDFWGDAMEEEKVNVKIIRENEGQGWLEKWRLTIAGKTVEGFPLPNNYENDYDNSIGGFPSPSNNNVFMDKVRTSLGSIIDKHKRIVGVFTNNIKRYGPYSGQYIETPEIRVYDFKGQLQFSRKFDLSTKQINSTEKILYHYFENTPLLLVSEWWEWPGGGRGTSFKSYFYNLSSNNVYSFNTGLKYVEYYEFFDLQRNENYRNPNGENCFKCKGVFWSTTNPYLSEQKLNELFNAYKPKYKHLFIAQNHDVIYRNSYLLYGIDLDNKIEFLGEKKR